ncbi:forkhead box protein R1 [Myripristis murdjan]|uniref:Forkhead box R1 n=1 Tax=Myripristis murdjan TaxID=586833 RepID=A0A668AVB9_9TELE|nr:forkhead box protein N5-like [Myripristis murdjan]
MWVQLQVPGRFLELHGCSGLTDWDMDEEMKLTTTTDQFHYDDKLSDQYLAQWHAARIQRRRDEYTCHSHTSDSCVRPNLWLMVNPNLACPIQYSRKTLPKPDVDAEPRPALSNLHLSAMLAPHAVEATQAASSSEHKFRGEDGGPWVDFPVNRRVQSRRKGRSTKSRDSKLLKVTGWPRPPVNYCILIAMALSNSHTGSLNVQQIYNFTREHFPFFQTAPDGWKNTIRHNLCFSNSFRKTPHQLCREGKRKSCLWHLTLDGRCRLRDEIHTLTRELLKELKRSMSHPDLIQSLFEL